MSATRTLAVSSGLGALFLLHGCGDKTPVVEAPADQADVVVADAVDADGDVAPPPVSSSGNWGDVVNYIAEKKLTKGEFKDFRTKFEKKVTVNSSSDDQMFDSSSAVNTISVVLNDWNHGQTGCAKTSDNFANAFHNEKRDRAEVEIDIQEFGLFHTIMEGHGNAYVADPAQIKLSAQSKWTKAVFFAMDKEDNDVWIRGDDDDQKKAKLTKEQLRPMNMVVVFTATQYEKFPYKNRNNFAMAVVNPKDASSPVDVFKASLKTFEIVFTVMSAAKQMQDGKQDTYRGFEDNFKNYQQKNQDAQPLNWWGAYSDHDDKNKNSSEPIDTKLVGGQCPVFGKMSLAESDAIEYLENISKEMKKFFDLKASIMKGNARVHTIMKYEDAVSNKLEETQTVDGATDRDIKIGPPGKQFRALSGLNSLYSGACFKPSAEQVKTVASVENEPRNEEEIRAFYAEHCVPHPAHVNSLFWRVRAVAGHSMKTFKDDFKFKHVHCEEGGSDCLAQAQNNIKSQNLFESAEMKKHLHEVMYAEFPQYAAKVHDVQTAIVEFYKDYTDENIKDRFDGGGDEEYVLSDGKRHTIYQIKKEFFTLAKLSKGVAKMHEPLPSDAETGAPITNEIGEHTATFSIKQNDFFGQLADDVEREICVWDALFTFLGRYSSDDISKFVPQTKDDWITSFDKMKVDDDLTVEWQPYKFPSERSLSTAEVHRIYVGPQSDQAEINAAIYAGLMLQFYQDFHENERKKPKFFLATADAKKAEQEASVIKHGQFEMIGAQLKEMPTIVLAGSEWSDAKAKAESLFLEKKAKKQGSITAGGF